MNPQIDTCLAKLTQWRDETRLLREFLLSCGLTETLKWGKPCYTFEQSNVVIIQGFKAYCALMFFKGALLDGSKGVLKQVGEHSQAARQIRFTSVQEIKQLEPVIKATVAEAIETEKAGLKVEFKKAPEPIPEELQKKFVEDPAFNTAFHALTPGRQRGYILHFSSPKQSKTREARIEKCAPQILEGKGLLDR